MTKLLRFLIKLDKIASQFLVLLMILFILSGYRIAGKSNLRWLMSMKTAEIIHTKFDILLIILFLYHVSIHAYLKIKVWIRGRYGKKQKER